MSFSHYSLFIPCTSRVCCTDRISFGIEIWNNTYSLLRHTRSEESCNFFNFVRWSESTLFIKTTVELSWAPKTVIALETQLFYHSYGSEVLDDKTAIFWQNQRWKSSQLRLGSKSSWSMNLLLCDLTEYCLLETNYLFKELNTDSDFHSGSGQLTLKNVELSSGLVCR